MSEEMQTQTPVADPDVEKFLSGTPEAPEPGIPCLDEPTVPLTAPLGGFQPTVEKPTKLVPIELKNINLSIELRVPATAGEEFGKTQKLLDDLRAKFGKDALIEELAQVLSGTIEKVSISYPEKPSSLPAAAQQAGPVQVSIPQTSNDVANYAIQSACPWQGNSLKNLDPASIYKIVYDPAAAQHRSLLSQQDLAMMGAYYKQWYEAQQKQTPPGTGPASQTALSFDEDNISF